MFYPSQFKAEMPLESPLVVYPILAKNLGLNQAIVIQQLHYWLTKNERSAEHIVEDCVWCYNTIDQWHENFSFWSRNTVIRTIESLVNTGLIVKKNLNKHKQIKTYWYTINYELFTRLISSDKTTEIRSEVTGLSDSKALTQNGSLGNPNWHIQQPKMGTTATQNGLLYNYTENTTENTTDIIKEINKEKSKSKFVGEKFIDTLNLLPAVKDLLSEWYRMRKDKPTQRAIELVTRDLLKHTVADQIQMIENSLKNGWKGIFELKPSFNQKNDSHNIRPGYSTEGVGRVVDFSDMFEPGAFDHFYKN